MHRMTRDNSSGKNAVRHRQLSTKQELRHFTFNSSANDHFHPTITYAVTNSDKIKAAPKMLKKH